jgi:hypothetical protein
MANRSFNHISLKVWLSIVFTVLLFFFIIVTVAYEETLGKSNVVVQVLSNQFGVLFTDQGTFRYFEPLKSRRIGKVRLRFWHQTQSELNPQLRVGCHYEIETIRSLFSSHELGENQMPPQTTIVGVVRRIEPVERDCDVSKFSGKPVCRDDQVTYIKGKGVFPKETDCDYESFDRKAFQRRRQAEEN